MRAVAFVQNYGELVKTRRKEVKDSIAGTSSRAGNSRPSRSRAPTACARALYHRMRQFLERYDFLLCPVNQLPPFPAESSTRR
jgi:amidase